MQGRPELDVSPPEAERTLQTFGETSGVISHNSLLTATSFHVADWYHPLP
jgi:hypothetical protein